ncbi:ChaN family lipoprotein [Aliivibrio sp. S3MY1]|uniref:ChaN family lipoprotein n=1 Tax=unclassified Aliivibrio TaxID=2645654 RepID=UPI0023798700|nr:MULTISPECIES: ChaN family lipoprotein [unclassified Aliivibrio]MDD9194995.1 ChaN family lipoprotein [Aliivibrio sp. S3MY1]MDD9198291.1 ChaN family lipoprotein [Aliivibrio sp. S2MY1]
MKSTVLFSLASVLLLSGCSQQIQSTSAPSQAITSFYDYQLLSPAGSPLSLSALPQEIIDADVILIGEWHTHAAIHRFQTDLFKQLSATNPKLALSMEQFSRNKQTVVDEYLSGKIGEQTLMSDANAWPNYESDYRPLVEIAKAKGRDVIAANAPKPIVKCIGQQGISYVDKLDIDEKSWLAKNIDLSDSPYKSKFLASMHHGDEEQTQKQFAAQMTWDATMAESIVNYLALHPKAQIMHIAGKFHIENGLGTAAQIVKLNPKLNVVVISPIEKASNEDSDYQLEVLTPPKRFVKQENMMKAYKAIKNRNHDLVCK